MLNCKIYSGNSFSYSNFSNNSNTNIINNSRCSSSNNNLTNKPHSSNSSRLLLSNNSSKWRPGQLRNKDKAPRCCSYGLFVWLYVGIVRVDSLD